MMSASSSLSKDTPCSFSKEEQQELEANLELAFRCNEYVQSLHIMSPNNCKEALQGVDNELKLPVLLALSTSLEKLRDEASEFEKTGKQPSWATENMKSSLAGEERYHVAICEGVKKFHLGNCQEMCLLALAYLKQQKCHQKHAVFNLHREEENVVIQGKLIKQVCYSHAFLLLGENPKTKVIIDPWNRSAPYYPFSQIEKKLKNCRNLVQRDGAPTLIDFNEKKDRIEIEYSSDEPKKNIIRMV